jgi:hypothetical protein
MQAKDWRKSIEITRDVLERMVYFVLLKYAGDPLHHQGTSAKRDLIGGYIERWLNRIAETTIFDHLLEDKKYKAVSDFFLYKNDTEKIAPDILGLKLESGKMIPFSKYKNGTWVMVPKMPRIEVKVVRKDQKLVGVRDNQFINDFYVFVESDLEPNYLTALFSDNLSLIYKLRNRLNQTVAYF